MRAKRVVIAGGGAAGFFAAIHCRSGDPRAEVTILEKSPEVLAKVAISGGGRCNLTHACFDPRALIEHYPRGSRELLGPFHRWNPRHTIDWFEDLGVSLKTEADGRVFPVSDSSQTIVDCLEGEAKRLGVSVCTGQGLRQATWNESTAGFELGQGRVADYLVLATGGNRRSGGLEVAHALGHRMVPPVPSLFTFHTSEPLLKGLAGISVPAVTASIAGSRLSQEGPILITHWGLSGPVVLKLSAWGARELAERDYHFDLAVNWLGGKSRTDLEEELARYRKQKGARPVRAASPFASLPRRLWDRMTRCAAIGPDVTWSQLPRAGVDRLLTGCTDCRLTVTGKSMNKDEFVTCGGVSLKDVNMKTMESRVQPGLYLAGEILDIDGVTGGFNFQAAWTTGFLAGTAISRAER